MTRLGAPRADAQGAAVSLADAPSVSTDPNPAALPRPVSSGAVRVGRNSVLLLVGTLTARLCAFLATVVTVRLLTPSDFAIIVLAQAVVAYFAMVLDFGLTLAGMRLVAHDASNLRRAMGSVLLIRLVVSATGLIVIAWGSVALGISGQATTVVLLFAGAAAVSALDLSWVLLGLQRMGLRSFVVAGTAVMNLALIIVLLLLRQDPRVVGVAYLLASIFVTTASGALVLRDYGMPIFSGGGLIRGLALAGIPLGLASLLAQVYYNFDILLLGALRSAIEVATYGAVYKIVLGLLMLAGTYGIVCLPAYAAAHQRSDLELRRLLLRNMRLLGSFILPVALVGTFVAEPATTVIFGERYVGGGVPLAILLWSVVLAFLSSSVLYALAAAGRGWVLTTAAAAGALVNVVVNVALIPKYGMVGAAVATVAAEAAVLAVVWRSSRALFDTAAMLELIRLVPPTAAMIAVALLTNPVSTYLAIACGLAAFVTLAMFSTVWTREDRQLLRSVLVHFLPVLRR